MSQPRKITISREALLKAVAQIVKDQSVGMADMDCVAMNAVLVDQRKGGVTETFPLDTIEVELVPVAAKAPANSTDKSGRVFTAPTGRGKIKLVSVDGALVA